MGYSTHLTDKQWAKIELIFKNTKGANFVKHSFTTINNQLKNYAFDILTYLPGDI